MIIANLSLPNCKEIKLRFAEDCKRFGNRRYSWYFTRDKNIEADLRYRYVADTDELIIASGETKLAVTCLEGSFAVTVENEDGENGEYPITGIMGNMIAVSGAASVRLASQEHGSRALILSDTKLPGVADGFRFEEMDDGIILISSGTDGGITPVYDGDAFSGGGMTGFMTFVNYDTMHFADTFRGMYCQSGPREYSSLITCTSGSVDVYAIDLRKYSANYRRSFAVHLDSINKSVFFQAGFALGFHSKSDNAALLTANNNYYDRKSQHVINISECPPAAEIVRPGLIMSTLDRYADKLGEGQNQGL